ncbi:MAG: branched-chain amino acid ABC transporter permease [Pyrobaculum arsenaticum]|uniref:Amino acid/amide ABC transporter membrane protein 2, HAAT family n=2 Tax=Pyrobaculum arsenaticum TaxID=121277 RepID=A4WI29_PYRAR|nr:branched-chain amino acid ABC transporter permease [Pyrobaculum arsenaticum]ABP50046.1 amino acid/amide ABC transporter membrane protein 2, HAAT family [Pyrobaculum arsenaticum DSM 13514]MCY0889638.1 branched-chain amino acid ABC transporter permease [Pyrobaculum arsenaticum]NYR14985.1 branched-chain amino acid ABC transporter permease [Pyrobaculum arsenaticum]
MRPYIPLGTYLLLMALAFVFPEYSKLIASIAFFMALGQAGNIFVGLTGYVNFGFVAFLAMGAYGLGVTVYYITWLGILALPVGLLLGVGLAAALASVVGAIALRLRGAYFAIATIGVNEGVKYLIVGANIWGGGAGLILSSSMFRAFGRETALFLANVGSTVLILATGLIAVVAMYLIQAGKAGYALAAIRQDEDAAKAIGINPTKYKLLAFITSASLSGLLGAAYFSLGNMQIFPENVFFVDYILDGLAVMFLGGATTVTGPIIGGLIYFGVRYLVGIYLPGLQALVTALIVFVVVVFMPKGIVGTLIDKMPSLKSWLP